jgi:hypothetical protein
MDVRKPFLLSEDQYAENRKCSVISSESLPYRISVMSVEPFMGYTEMFIYDLTYGNVHL